MICDLFIAPSQPQSLEIVTVTSTAVTLLWKPPEFPNGTITKYSIHYNEIHVDGFGDNVLDKMTGTIEGLSPDIEYVIKLIAYTRVGPGPPFSLPVKTRKFLNNYSEVYHLIFYFDW